jgi:phospholipid transport system substrate-binding protein
MVTMRNSVPGPALGRRHLLLAAGAGAALPVARAGAADTSAETFIERLGQETIEILKQRSLPPEERAKKLKAVLNQATDIQYVARVILGRHWRSASEDQRKEYLRLFDALVLQAMAERIDSYAGQTFDISGSRKVDDTDTVVSTNIAQPSGGPTYRVDWRVRKGENGQSLLIDIVAEGVSLVITQRSEANDIVNRGGVDGLLTEMRRRLEQRNVSGAQPPA